MPDPAWAGTALRRAGEGGGEGEPSDIVQG